MNIQPITRSLLSYLESVDVKKFTLNFQGGDDNGYLNTEFTSTSVARFTPGGTNVVEKIENWAWSVYDYSGAGDGTGYGDNIEYDLVNGTVSHESWLYVPAHTASEPVELDIEEDESVFNKRE